MRALFTAATGMNAQQLKIDNIANNLANINTTSFKKGRENFEDLFYQRVRSTGINANATQTPAMINIGHGVRTADIEKLFTQGTVAETKNDLDIAIEGQGFFQLEGPNGETLFTRAGNFKRNANGEIINSDGYKLKPGLSIPTDAISLTISQDGTVSSLQAGQSEQTQLGTIELARFVNPGGLEPLGRNLYRQTDGSGQPITGAPSLQGMGTVMQGFLESSNVDIAEEMIAMIMAQRSYETNSKVMTAADEMMHQANGIVR